MHAAKKLLVQQSGNVANARLLESWQCCQQPHRQIWIPSHQGVGASAGKTLSSELVQMGSFIETPTKLSKHTSGIKRPISAIKWLLSSRNGVLSPSPACPSASLCHGQGNTSIGSVPKTADTGEHGAAIMSLFKFSSLAGVKDEYFGSFLTI